MAPKPRSLKQQMDAHTRDLRARGWTWRQIAADYQDRFKLNPLRAFREAHRYTQATVVQLWNQRWPDEPLNARRLGAWEAWPASTGNEPPISGLDKLARIYQCRAGDLIDGEDHGHADEQATPHHPADLQPTASACISPADVRGILQQMPAPAPVGDTTTGPMLARVREQEFGYLVAVLTQWADDMKRRDLLALIASAAAAAHASPLLAHLDDDALERLALAARTPSRVDQQAVSHIEAILQHAIHQEDILGPHAVLETMLAQHRLVRRLLTATPGEALERRLTSLLADLSRFIGWLAFNAGDFAGAEYFYAQARRAAHDADDDLMTSYVLSQWSHLATWTGDPRMGIEHALGALSWAKRAASPILASYAHDVGARAYAGLLRRQNSQSRGKDYGRCRAAMAASRAGLIDTEAEDPARDLLYFFTPNMLALTRALCHLDMHEPDTAIASAREALTTMGTFPRNQAFCRLYLSRAHAQLREIDQAGAELSAAVQLTGHNRSDRLVTAAAAARQALSPWERTDTVMRLDEQLRVYGLPVGRSSST